jgi:catechol 2,3-dioxygenase-like lactoylglutathione lyase family enzyme
MAGQSIPAPALHSADPPQAAIHRRVSMLSDYMVHPSLATADLGQARNWYAQRLGLAPFLSFPGLLAYQVGPTIFTVFQTPAAGTAQNTVALWRVPDLRAEMARLRARGVVFEDLDLGGDQRTMDGIMTSADVKGGTVRNGWFRDGDRNWIGMVEQPDHPGEPPAGMGVGVALAATDLARAQAWYAEKLGLEPLHVIEGEELVYRQGATHLTIYVTPSAGTAKNTVAVWRVDDLRAEVGALRSRGVAFGDYEIAGVRTVDGVYTDPDDGSLAAWFMDSEGNTLGLAEDRGEPIRAR